MRRRQVEPGLRWEIVQLSEQTADVGWRRVALTLGFPRHPGAFEDWSDLEGARRKALSPAPRKYLDELRERAVRPYRECQPRPSFKRLAGQLNAHSEALRNWVRQAEADAGERDDRPSTDMAAGNRRPAAENAELRRVNEVLRAASAHFASETGPSRRWS